MHRPLDTPHNLSNYPLQTFVKSLSRFMLDKPIKLLSLPGWSVHEATCISTTVGIQHQGKKKKKEKKTTALDPSPKESRLSPDWSGMVWLQSITLTPCCFEKYQGDQEDLIPAVPNVIHTQLRISGCTENDILRSPFPPVLLMTLGMYICVATVKQLYGHDNLEELSWWFLLVTWNLFTPPVLHIFSA